MKIKKVILADKSLDIYVNEGFVYDIPFSRMRTPEAILDWVHQICIAKNWGRENAAEILERRTIKEDIMSKLEHIKPIINRVMEQLKEKAKQIKLDELNRKMGR